MFLALMMMAVASPGDPLVATERIVNRGEVRIGPPLTQRYVLTNRGASPLTITNVTSTCGCLKPNLERRELPRVNPQN